MCHQSAKSVLNIRVSNFGFVSDFEFLIWSLRHEKIYKANPSLHTHG